MRILALDMSRMTGYAVTNGESGVFNLTPTKDGVAGQRYSRLRLLLSEQLRKHPDISCVVYEEAFHRGKAASDYARGYAAILQCWCLDYRIDHKPVNLKTVKKFITGKGNADKKQVMAAVRKKLGIEPIDDNHADALAILAWASQ